MLKIFLFLALVAILFGGAEPFVQFWRLDRLITKTNLVLRCETIGNCIGLAPITQPT